MVPVLALVEVPAPFCFTVFTGLLLVEEDVCRGWAGPVSKSLRVATLVKTVLVEAIRPPDDVEIEFRVDIFSWSEHEYSCQVWRLDTYRVQPTFQAPSQLADEQWLVRDLVLDWKELRAATADGLLALLFEQIERRFGVKVDLPA
jgi:hypothetical protein